MAAVLGLAPDALREAVATTVARGVQAQYHQHMFSVRVDPMVDGLAKAHRRAADFIASRIRQDIEAQRELLAAVVEEAGVPRALRAGVAVRRQV